MENNTKENNTISADLVKKEEYKGYTYFIVYVYYGWYCAYIVLPETSKYYKCDYYSIPLEVHGGLTFADKHPFADDKWCIGWDYAHYGDIIGLGGFEDGAHRWTSEEIERECKEAIDNLIDLEK